MRTTIEMQDGHRARLLEIAARRGEKGFSNLIAEAIEHYLTHNEESTAAREAALALKGVLDEEETKALRDEAAALRESWR